MDRIRHRNPYSWRMCNEVAKSILCPCPERTGLGPITRRRQEPEREEQIMISPNHIDACGLRREDLLIASVRERLLIQAAPRAVDMPAGGRSIVHGTILGAFAKPVLTTLAAIAGLIVWLG